MCCSDLNYEFFIRLCQVLYSKGSKKGKRKNKWKETFRRNVHVSLHELFRKVHGNFHVSFVTCVVQEGTVDICMYLTCVAQEGTWKFPCIYFHISLRV